MAHDVNQLRSQYQTQIISCLTQLDEAEWLMESAIDTNAASVTKDTFNRKIAGVIFLFEQLIDNINQCEHTYDIKESLTHCDRKITRLIKKYQPFIQAPTNQPPAPLQLSQKPALHPIPPSSQPTARRNPVSFSIKRHPASFSTAQGVDEAPKKTIILISSLLSRISHLLREGKEDAALQEAQALSPEAKRVIFGALWHICGKPMGDHPKAHAGFGEVSFFKTEQRCESTRDEKAAAVEWAKLHSQVMDIISCFGQENFEAGKKLLLALPAQMQGAIYSLHWEVCGKPGEGNPMAHNNFGAVSMLRTELRCIVSLDLMITTLEKFSSQFGLNCEKAQELIAKEKSEWSNIDSSRMRGYDKSAAKKERLNQLVPHLAMLLCNTSNLNPVDARGDSVGALAFAYIKAYPFLRPFLFPLLEIQLNGEQLLEAQSISLNNCKSSTAQDPQLSKMDHQTRTNYRINIMEETLATLAQSFYINSKGEKVCIDLKPAVESLECVASTHCEKRPKRYPNTVVYLDGKDCLTVARYCAERGLNPAVLDMASMVNFGGGYKTGAGAQEEYLCRASGLSVAVDPKLGVQTKNFYPLNKEGQGDTAGLYVAHVPVFRGEEGHGYPYLDRPFETAFLISAAVNFNVEHQTKNGVENPPALEGGENSKLRIPHHFAEMTKGKIRTVLHMAEQKGHDAVVLGAFGCGAFCTPPLQMADLMMQVIVQEFPNSFKEIRFAILDDHNAGKAHNPNGNYADFGTMIGYFDNPMKDVGMSFKVT